MPDWATPAEPKPKESTGLMSAQPKAITGTTFNGGSDPTEPLIPTTENGRFAYDGVTIDPYRSVWWWWYEWCWWYEW